MKSMFVLLFLLVCGCANTSSPASGYQGDEIVIPTSYFSGQERCFLAWQELLDEWVAINGGMRHSVRETRLVIAEDEDSALSRLFRKVWLQLGGSTSVDARDVALAFEAVASEEVLAGCGSIVWLQPLLVETPSVLTEEVLESLLEEAPKQAREDSRTFSRWLSYELLIPVD